MKILVLQYLQRKVQNYKILLLKVLLVFDFLFLIYIGHNEGALQYICFYLLMDILLSVEEEISLAL